VLFLPASSISASWAGGGIFAWADTDSTHSNDSSCPQTRVLRRRKKLRPRSGERARREGVAHPSGVLWQAPFKSAASHAPRNCRQQQQKIGTETETVETSAPAAKTRRWEEDRARPSWGSQPGSVEFELRSRPIRLEVAKRIRPAGDDRFRAATHSLSRRRPIRFRRRRPHPVSRRRQGFGAVNRRKK